MSGPCRAGELWGSRAAPGRLAFLVVDSYERREARFWSEPGQWVQLVVDLSRASGGVEGSDPFEVEERVLSDPSSGWFRFA